jgi:cephalosporin hydroxylase
VASKVTAEVNGAEVVIVVLDSNHTKANVLEELRLYSQLVTIGSYIVVTNGIMELVAGGPRTAPEWAWNNPRQAVHEFVNSNPEFEIEVSVR